MLLLENFYSLSLFVASMTQTVPFQADVYTVASSTSLSQILYNRIVTCPFNLIASLIFICAILHTFVASKFTAYSHSIDPISPGLRAKKVLFHFLGEVEAIFGIWILPLLIAMLVFLQWKSIENYFQSVSYTEPMFIVVIMTIAASRPILYFSKMCMSKLAAIGNSSIFAWWISILTIGPLLGSFITEPAAITISAMLLAEQFYKYEPKLSFKYATLGLLFVNISVGGTLTHFAAPPVLMVAGKWGWTTSYMFSHFGWKAIVGIVVSNLLYAIIFRNEFSRMQFRLVQSSEKEFIPFGIVVVHLLFLAWTVFTLHTPVFFIFGFLFYLAFVKITAEFQYTIDLKSPVLVGFFLAGLVTHGGLQQWWIEPVLGKLNEMFLFLGATVLTAFNDNAAITYLSSLVQEVATNSALQHAVVAGAVTGGGLTLIANAPNPAGQSILQKFFGNNIKPKNLFFGALFPTFIVACCFCLL